MPEPLERNERLLASSETSIDEGGIDHAAIVRWLSNPSSYPHTPAAVEVIETLMSWVFIAGDLVYKMKKAIRLAFVDFTSVAARHENCVRELTLNQRLAPGIYREVIPLMRASDGDFQFDGAGAPVEWLLVMNRLDQEQLLNKALARGDVRPFQIDELCDCLGSFYRDTPQIGVGESDWYDWWQEAVDANARSLTDPLFALPQETVREIVFAGQEFLKGHRDVLLQPVREGRILDGHGDLRPEHVHLGPPLRLIDRLEFNARLRWADPFDEVAFLGMECGRLGGKWIARQLVDGLAKRLGERPPELLLSFYTSHSAAMRARLSIEHMRDSQPRTPERWPRQAREYLEIALASLPT